MADFSIFAESNDDFSFYVLKDCHKTQIQQSDQ